MNNEHYEGIGCTCHAHVFLECCCPDADWRSVREVKLEAENVRLREDRDDWKGRLNAYLDGSELARLRKAMMATLPIDTAIKIISGNTLEGIE